MTEFLQALILGLLVGGVYALLASGLTLIFGVMNVINIAHVAFLILAAFVTWSLWRAIGLDPLAAILVLTPAMFAFGWVIYNVTIRPIRRAPPAASVLLTFGLALFLEGIMGVIWGNTSHSVRPAYFTESFRIGELFLPEAGEFIGYWRMRDWLRLLDFEVESGNFGLYRPAVRSQSWLERYRWVDKAGERWWPIFGAVYFIVAVKRVRGMTMLQADWKRKPAITAAPVPVTGRVHRVPQHHHKKHKKAEKEKSS